MSPDRSTPGEASHERDVAFAVSDSAICFGPFVLNPKHHQLLKNGEPVPLGSRAMLLLIAMATRAGELLEKTELLALGWPKVVVEECNLRAQILTLRKALTDSTGSSCIVTVPGRGYRFVAQISAPTLDAPPVAPQANSLPPPSTPRLLGRNALLNQLDEQLQRCRFITVTGPAGIGKTTVALALANRLRARFAHGTTFIDLAPVSRGQLVHVVIAAALGIDCTTDEPLTVISRSLAKTRTLLILDNCEHVLKETATAIEGILRNAPLCSIVVTSREPLRAEGEFVHDLTPLLFPPKGARLSTEQALKYPAIELFVERVAAHDLGYTLRDEDVMAAAEICRKLDGNALAIEIAAARVRAFGIAPLVDMLDGSFRLQMTGRRTALPRHRTLSAALDWTYAMLASHEQSMLAQLSVFAGLFTLRAAESVIEIGDHDVAGVLESLMDKSLVITSAQGSTQHYCLLETTRLYAAQKLADQGQRDATALRHTHWMLDELKASVQALLDTTPRAWLARYGAEVDGVRAALEWAYSPEGQQALAVELTLVSVPLWLRLSLTGECYDWVSRGLTSTGERLSTPRQRMLLLTVSASVRVLAFGGGPSIRQAWLQVQEDALAMDDIEHQLRALWGLWNDRTCANQYVAALELAERYIALSQNAQRSERQLLGLRMRANALFHMGRLGCARQAVIEALSSPLSANSHMIDLHFDQRVAARALKAQIQWLQGDIEPALVTLTETVNQAISLNHPATLWYTLCLSVLPATLFVGQLQEARKHLRVLQASMEGHDLYLWRQFARSFECILTIREGDAEQGVPELGEILEQLREQGDSPLFSLIRCEYAQGLAMLGLERRALEVIDETLAIVRGREERWFIPELLRVKAQMLSAKAPRALASAHRVLSEALDEASLQGALFWAERITTDLASLNALDPRKTDVLCLD